jgi:hypothetical protein
MAGKKMTKIKEMARKGQKIGRKPPKIGFQGVLGQKRVKKAIFRPFLAENRPFLVEKNGHFGSETGHFWSKNGHFGSEIGLSGTKDGFFVGLRLAWTSF